MAATGSNRVCFARDDVLWLITQHLRLTGLHRSALTLLTEAEIDGVWLCGSSLEVAQLRQWVYAGNYAQAQAWIKPLGTALPADDVRAMDDVISHAKAMEDFVVAAQAQDTGKAKALFDLLVRNPLTSEQEQNVVLSKWTQLDTNQRDTAVHDRLASVWSPERTRLDCFDRLVGFLRSPLEEDMYERKYQDMRTTQLLELLEDAMQVRANKGTIVIDELDSGAAVWDCITSAPDAFAPAPTVWDEDSPLTFPLAPHSRRSVLPAVSKSLSLPRGIGSIALSTMRPETTTMTTSAMESTHELFVRRNRQNPLVCSVAGRSRTVNQRPKVAPMDLSLIEAEEESDEMASLTQQQRRRRSAPVCNEVGTSVVDWKLVNQSKDRALIGHASTQTLDPHRVSLAIQTEEQPVFRVSIASQAMPNSSSVMVDTSDLGDNHASHGEARIQLPHVAGTVQPHQRPEDGLNALKASTTTTTRLSMGQLQSRESLSNNRAVVGNNSRVFSPLPMASVDLRKEPMMDNNDDNDSNNTPETSASTKSSRNLSRPSYATFTSEAVMQAQVSAEVNEPQAIRAMDISPDGEQIVIGTNARALRVFDLSSPLALSAMRASRSTSSMAMALRPLLPVVVEKHKHHASSIYTVACDHKALARGDGMIVASGAADSSIKVLAVATDRQVHIRQHAGKSRALVFAGNGWLCSAASGDLLVRCWDYNHSVAASCLHFDGHVGEIQGLALSPGEAQLVSCALDKTLRLWDFRTGKCERLIGKPFSSACALQFQPGSAMVLASGHQDGTVCLWDARQTNRTLQSLTAHRDECRALTWSPDGRWLGSASFDATVCLMEMTAERGLQSTASFQQHSDKVLSARWHPQQPALVTTGADKSVKLWTFA
ncbi:TPA: hypothetical protein N0F65_011581 [Lagenidium giganteum]|uniref:Uncharacterized protein n=1 Tax=Lagenidium giganteum TaxID=4803 RepID=A0AAV2YHW8_9STRA|nr:TPA: hypothetical protein N0F65_011581 [Lagenidium giganteum]